MMSTAGPGADPTPTRTDPTTSTTSMTGTTGATSTDTRSTAVVLDDDAPAPPGRPVRLVPTPAGFWRVVGGVVVAMLAPFFGILIGSTMGSSEVTSRMDPLYWGFFIGCAIGALGLVSLGLGARTLLRESRARSAAAPEDDGEHR